MKLFFFYFCRSIHPPVFTASEKKIFPRPCGLWVIQIYFFFIFGFPIFPITFNKHQKTKAQTDLGKKEKVVSSHHRRDKTYRENVKPQRYFQQQLRWLRSVHVGTKLSAESPTPPPLQHRTTVLRPTEFHHQSHISTPIERRRHRANGGHRSQLESVANGQRIRTTNESCCGSGAGLRHTVPFNHTTECCQR